MGKLETLESNHPKTYPTIPTYVQWDPVGNSLSFPMISRAAFHIPDSPDLAESVLAKLHPR